MLKESTTGLNINQMRPILEIDKDLEDDNSISLVLTMCICLQSIVNLHSWKFNTEVSVCLKVRPE